MGHGIHCYQPLWSLRHVVDLVPFYIFLFVFKWKINKNIRIGMQLNLLKSSVYITSVRRPTLPCILTFQSKTNCINKWHVFLSYENIDCFLSYLFICSPSMKTIPACTFRLTVGIWYKYLQSLFKLTWNKWVTSLFPIESLIQNARKKKDMPSGLNFLFCLTHGAQLMKYAILQWRQQVHACWQLLVKHKHSKYEC